MQGPVEEQDSGPVLLAVVAELTAGRFINFDLIVNATPYLKIADH
jgi:hypothetical protein